MSASLVEAASETDEGTCLMNMIVTPENRTHMLNICPKRDRLFEAQFLAAAIIDANEKYNTAWVAERMKYMGFA